MELKPLCLHVVIVSKHQGKNICSSVPRNQEVKQKDLRVGMQVTGYVPESVRKTCADAFSSAWFRWSPRGTTFCDWGAMFK